MKPGRIIFVNRFYWPAETATAQLLTDLAQSLCTRGYDVLIITARGDGRGAPRREIKNGVSVYRVRTTWLGRQNLFGRLVDFVTFYVGALWRLLRTVRSADTVVAMTDPPMLGVLAALATWPRRARLIHWIQDIYPEVAVELTGRRSLLAMRPTRNCSWRRAAACVVPGAQMAESLTRAGIGPARIIVSPNWAPVGVEVPNEDEVAGLRQQWKLTGKFVVMYSGNLGRVHDLDAIIDVATQLRDVAEIAFVFVGDGARRERIAAAARDRSLANVSFFPAQARPNLGATLRLADLHFVALQPGMDAWVFPSKLYGIARVGRPVIFIGANESEIARCVRSAGLGETFERTDSLGIARALRDLQHDPARRAALGAAAQRFAARGFEEASECWAHLLGPGLAMRSGAP